MSLIVGSLSETSLEARAKSVGMTESLRPGHPHGGDETRLGGGFVNDLVFVKAFFIAEA